MAYRNIVILGNGAHSKVLVSEILKLKNFKIIGFVNYNKKFKKIITYNKKNYKNYKNIKDIKNIYNKKIYGIIGIGTNFIRKKAYLKKKVANHEPQIGFSDDDLRNVEKVKGHFENEPDNIIKTYSTAGGIKKRY